MDDGVLATLVVLALIDSTSIGTLFIPIWLLLQPERIPASRFVAYLATIAAFYAAVGLLLVVGVEQLAAPVGRALDSHAGLYVQLVLGVGMLLLSFRFDGTPRDERSNRVDRWQARAVRRSTSLRGLVALAVVAGVLELAMMLPYLGAIGIITTLSLGPSATALLVGSYAVVMVVPALLLFAGRTLAAARVDPVLERLNRWAAGHADAATGWVLGIAGVVVAADAASRLGFL